MGEPRLHRDCCLRGNGPRKGTTRSLTEKDEVSDTREPPVGDSRIKDRLPAEPRDVPSLLTTRLLTARVRTSVKGRDLPRDH